MVIDIPKIIDSIKAHKNIVLFVASLVLAVAMITLIVIFCGPAPKAQTASHPASQFTPKATEAVSTREQATTAAKATEKQTEAPETTEAEQTTAEATTQPATAAPGDVVFATAEPAADPADYQAQWDAGYLVAIDNPDTSYACYHIDLTDEDRELLENLCYGEFGTGGFIGAALIAQAVKDAMCFDGYTTIPDVRCSTVSSICTRRIWSTAPSTRVRTLSSAISRSASLTAGAHKPNRKRLPRTRQPLDFCLSIDRAFSTPDKRGRAAARPLLFYEHI